MSKWRKSVGNREPLREEENMWKIEMIARMGRMGWFESVNGISFEMSGSRQVAWGDRRCCCGEGGYLPI